MEARRGRPPYPGVVTPAEERVLDLVRTGLTNAEIAVLLGVSINTVRYHVTNLLAKANAETREELRSWEPGGARPNPLKLMTPLIPGFKALGVAAVVAVVGVATVTAITILASREGTPEAAVPGVEVATTQPDLPVLPSDRVSTVPTIAIVTWNGQDRAIHLIDAHSGSELARAPTGYNAIVTFRRSAGELLVSHFLSADSNQAVVDVLDANNGLALKRRLQAPDRAGYTIYWPHAQVLSADARYLALSTMTMRDELPDCASRQLDGPSCARNGVRIMDVESGEQWWFELPRYCGGGAFHPLDESGFAVVCTDRIADATAYRKMITPTGSQNFVTEPLPDWEGRGRGAFHAYADNGWIGTLPLAGASFTWWKAGQDSVQKRAVPMGQVVRWPIFAEVGGGRLIIGYVPATGSQYPDGLAVFNMMDGVIERDLQAFDISRSMIASGPNTLVATTTDGRLIEIDVTTGASRDLAQLGANPENVALVR